MKHEIVRIEYDDELEMIYFIFGDIGGQARLDSFLFDDLTTIYLEEVANRLSTLKGSVNVIEGPDSLPGAQSLSP